MFVVVAAAVMVGWRQRRRYVFPAIVFLVATTLHVVLAQMGWWERYQAYLVALGVVTLLAIADEVVPTSRRPPARSLLVPAIALLALVLCSLRVSLTVDVPKAALDTYQQRYQAARFLAEYYDGEPVATSELGYASLEHRGPLTDIFGLGDYAVLQARRSSDQHPPPEYWARLQEERGFKVAVFYPQTLLLQAPESWTHVASFHMDHEPVSTPEPVLGDLGDGAIGDRAPQREAPRVRVRAAAGCDADVRGPERTGRRRGHTVDPPSEWGERCRAPASASSGRSGGRWRARW